MRRISPGNAVLFLLLVASGAPAQVDPAALPARDAHEGLLVAADPYQDAARAQERFGKKNPHTVGILAIEVFFRNDNDRPIHVARDRMRLLLDPPAQARQRLEPLAVEEVIDRIVYKGPPDLSVPRRPIPGRKPGAGRSKEWKQLEATLRPMALEMEILPPRSTVRGFVFFDLSHHFDWLPHARLYLPDLKFLHSDQQLFFFEVDLGKAGSR